jgi:hypothetical protein
VNQIEYDINEMIKDAPKELHIDKFKILECRLEYETRYNQGIVCIRLVSNFSNFKMIRDCPIRDILRPSAIDYFKYATDDLLGRYLSGLRDNFTKENLNAN